MLDESCVYADFSSRTPEERQQNALALENLELRQNCDFLRAQLAGANRQLAALMEEQNGHRFGIGEWCLVVLAAAGLAFVALQVLS